MGVLRIRLLFFCIKAGRKSATRNLDDEDATDKTKKAPLEFLNNLKLTTGRNNTFLVRKC